MRPYSYSNPWRIGEADNEDEIDIPYSRRNTLPPRSPKPPPSTPKAEITYSEPKIADWDPILIEENKKSKHGRKKTAPSFERAPSHHQPIFCGPPNLKLSRSVSLCSSISSLFEQNHHDKIIHTYSPETPPASPLVNKFNLDPFQLIQENLNKFIYSSIPKDYSSFIHCYLRRDRTGLQKGFFPTYYLHAEQPSDGKRFLLLAARKVPKINRQSEYLFTTNIETLNEKSAGDGFVGKLRANNLTSTEYTLYDNGKSPNKYGYKSIHSKHGLRRELAGIFYNTNILGIGGCKQINSIIPKLEHDIQPAQEEDTILDRWRDRKFNDILQLRSRILKYKKDTKTHILESTENMTVKARTNNFQMIIENENHEEEIVMEFGRVDKDTFICNYRNPLSSIQAFAIALSSFDSGITRE